ncbi:MAG TPA: hypothetical protein VL485_14435 [Ktedonobacteraceae bacterium]|jgi:hypothetical protein|nr:hypothetical protein [Ktedonobacteraceae bacterium]
MKLIQHAEYQGVYLYNQEAFQRCQAAIAQWKERNDSIAVPAYSLQWTYASTQVFVRALSQLFHEYNRIIWEDFNYCRQCGGQCCVSGASNVRPFDFIAVALLDKAIPVLQDNITAWDRECIYLSNHRCSWPDEWRTIKCWSFYCLGAGPWRADASISEMRGEIADKLQRLMRASLPPQLRTYEEVQNIVLADYLDEPLSFANALHNALGEIFVAPFSERYPALAMPPITTTVEDHNMLSKASSRQRDIALLPLFDEKVAAFIAEAIEQIYEHEIAVPEELNIDATQFLEDLESLQWIIEGHPSQQSKLLKEMSLRYANAPAPGDQEKSTLWYRMRDVIFTLLRF